MVLRLGLGLLPSKRRRDRATLTVAIFAKRTLARIFSELAPILPENRQRDLTGRLASAAEGDGPISAEWEIVLFNALRKGETLEFPSSDQRQLDAVFTFHPALEPAIVE